jgi:hypothetical protein
MEFSATTIQIVTTVVMFGIFIGVTQNSLKNIVDRLKKIEEKQDTQNEEHASLRERVAVLESKNHN